MKAVIVQPEAEADLREAVTWYEGREAGLGHRFVARVDEVLVRMAESPLQFPSFLQRAGRGRVRKFPYPVVFVDLEDRIVVLGVLHHRLPSKVS